MDFFDSMYENRATDVSMFGANYVGHNENFLDGKWHKVAVFEKEGDGDGQPCEIWESRLPARFYKIVALESKNSVGDVVRPWCMSTGSGQEMARLLVSMASKVAAGMLGLSDLE